MAAVSWRQGRRDGDRRVSRARSTRHRRCDDRLRDRNPLSRYVSLASILTAASVPLLFRFLTPDAPFWHIVMSIAIAFAVILKHHSNIARLAQQTERKMGRKKDDEE